MVFVSKQTKITNARVYSTVVKSFLKDEFLVIFCIGGENACLKVFYCYYASNGEFIEH